RLKARGAKGASALLAQQAEDARRKFADQHERLRAYTAANIGTLPQETAANLAALERLNTQLRLKGETQVRLIERRQTLQNQIAELDNRKTTTPVVDVNDPASRLAQMQRDRIDLATKWTENAPDLKDLDQKIDTLKRQIAASPKHESAPP